MAYGDQRVLAVVPARSGSKGLPNKNLAHVGGLSLIARAGRVLAALPWIDARVISTDSPEYAAEGVRNGLEAPFLRPAVLATDTAGAVETTQHAVREMEARCGVPFDVILIVEPTSPLRQPSDITDSVALLLADNARDAVVTVSAIDPKCHPFKIFRVEDGRLEYFDERGRAVVARQQLEPLYTRNGICYALRRATLMDHGTILGRNTRAVVIDRPLVNIDSYLDLALAEILLGAGDAR